MIGIVGHIPDSIARRLIDTEEKSRIYVGFL